MGKYQFVETVDAIQWVSAEDFEKHPERMKFFVESHPSDPQHRKGARVNGGMFRELFAGEWLVKDADGRQDVLSDGEFKKGLARGATVDIGKPSRAETLAKQWSEKPIGELISELFPSLLGPCIIDQEAVLKRMDQFVATPEYIRPSIDEIKAEMAKSPRMALLSDGSFVFLPQGQAFAEKKGELCSGT